jgi:hypothetical protein
LLYKVCPQYKVLDILKVSADSVVILIFMHSYYINNDMNVGFFSYYILGVEKCQE